MWRAEAGWWLVLGAHAVECTERRRGRRGPAARSATLPITPLGAETPEAALRRVVTAIAGAVLAGPAAAPSKRPGARLRVLVSDRWIALATVPWGQALLHPATHERFVRSHLDAAGFVTTPADTVRIDDDAGFGRPRIAAAYPAPLLALLAEAAAALGARLESVQPLEVALARLARQRIGRGRHALALLDGERLRFMTVGASSVTAGQLLEDTALLNDRSAALPTLWRRQQLRDPALGDAASLHLVELHGRAGGDGTPAGGGPGLVTWPDDPAAPLSPALRAALAAEPGAALNASKAARRAGPLAWAAGAACLVAAAVLALQAARLGESARMLELAAAARTPAPATPTPLRWTREELARIRAVNAAIREINLPIAALLRALQPPRDIRVALLGIAVEPTGDAAETADGMATLKLSAESASGAEMARYVGYLSGRAPLQRAYLVNHSVDETDAAYPYRFAVELAWRE